MAEREFEGHQVAFALKSKDVGPELAKALVHCCYYRDDPDWLVMLTSANGPDGPFTVQGKRGPEELTVGSLARGFIVETRSRSRIAPLLNKAVPEHLKAAEVAHRKLRERGIGHPSISNEDAILLHTALNEADDGYPSSKTQGRLYTLLHRYGLGGLYAELSSKWVGTTPPSQDEAVWQEFWRRWPLDNLQRAFQMTDAALAPEAVGQMDPASRAFLLAERASMHLLLFDHDQDLSRLKLARECADMAWAIQPSGRGNEVYLRLAKLTGQAEYEQLAAARRAEWERERNDLPIPLDRPKRRDLK
jgi:hypothetical protein